MDLLYLNKYQSSFKPKELISIENKAGMFNNKRFHYEQLSTESNILFLLLFNNSRPNQTICVLLFNSIKYDLVKWFMDIFLLKRFIMNSSVQ